MDLQEQGDQPQDQHNTPPSRKYKKRSYQLRGPQRKYRPEVIQPHDESVRLIALTRDQVVEVDHHLYEWLMEYNWYAKWDETTQSFYAARNSSTVNGRKTIISMHRQIVGPSPSEKRKVDHQSRDTLNNRGGNLRFADNIQSASNSGRRRNNKSGYKGVSAHSGGRKWTSQIQVNKNKMMLGLSLTKEDAARVYDRAAIKYHGNFAALNFPRSEYE